MADENNALVPVPNENDNDSDEFEDALSIDSESDNVSVHSVVDDDENAMGAHESRSRSENGASSSTVTFNRTLPASHLYLGRDLEDVSPGQTLLDSNAIIDNVPILPVPNLVLMPNQNLPLQSLHPRLIAMFRAIIAQSKVFGVVLRSYIDDTDQPLANIGTLAQVLAFKEETEHEITTLKIRAVGRQRFQIIQTQRQLDGVLNAKIRVLPDISTGNSLTCAESRTLSRHKFSSKKNVNSICTWFTPLPRFVYDQYDIKLVAKQIVDELTQWYDGDRIKELSTDATDFSYWVASIMPIDDDMKINLLRINCAVQRLRCELSLIRRCTLFLCRSCRSLIGKKAYVFSMSVMGPMNAYVNPHGHIMETLTLSEVERNCATTFGRATTENSWFPGYAWTIIQCARCHNHLGWRFNAAKKHLKPAEFWGITRASIVPTLDESSADPDDEKWFPTM